MIEQIEKVAKEIEAYSMRIKKSWRISDWNI